MSYSQLITATRILLGLQLFLGGLNWWFKIFPFPSMLDPVIAYSPDLPQKVEVGRMMISTGWMFTLAKVIELSTGIALLSNRLVPLMLTASISVTFSTFMVDAQIFGYVTNWINGSVSGNVVLKKVLDMIFFGGAVLWMHAFLLVAYFHYLVPIFTVQTVVEPDQQPQQYSLQPGMWYQKKCFKTPLNLIGYIAVILGILSTGWLILMINQWLLPWSSLGILVAR